LENFRMPVFPVTKKSCFAHFFFFLEGKTKEPID
jgi:hypothetical protein